MEEEEGSGYFLFGRDVMAIPCLRDSALAGFAAAFGVGITHFLFTSHGIKSFRYGQLAFIGVTFPYAFFCQHMIYDAQYKITTAQAGLKASTGSELLMTDSLEFGHDTFG